MFSKLSNIAALTMMSTAAMAHPGHDHGAADANTIHFVFAVSVIAVVVIGGIALFKRAQKQKNN